MKRPSSSHSHAKDLALPGEAYRLHCRESRLRGKGGVGGRIHLLQPHTGFRERPGLDAARHPRASGSQRGRGGLPAQEGPSLRPAYRNGLLNLQAPGSLLPVSPSRPWRTTRPSWRSCSDGTCSRFRAGGSARRATSASPTAWRTGCWRVLWRASQGRRRDSACEPTTSAKRRGLRSGRSRRR